MSSLAGVTRGPGRGALPALFPFLISSLDSLASLISRYPVQCYPCYLTQFDEKSRKCFVFQTIAWPGLGCGEGQELLLKNDSQTSLILFLFPKINEKGSLEKAGKLTKLPHFTQQSLVLISYTISHLFQSPLQRGQCSHLRSEACLLGMRRKRLCL